MKTLLTFTLLISSFFCFGQIKSDNLTGSWKNETNSSSYFKDSVPGNFFSKNFVLQIYKNRTFAIKSKEKQIQGKWILKDSVLYLLDKRNIKKVKKSKLRIYSLTKSELVLKPKRAKSEKALLKLVRVKRR